MDTLRISDADREAAVDLLSEQYAIGRLTRDEFDERSDAVWSAKTRGDLAPIFADLPVQGPARPGRTRAPVPAGAPHRPRWWPVPLAPVVIALVALTVLTHLPFVLLLVVLFFCVGRWRHAAWGPRPHAGRYRGRY
jgi:uncharacterized membrane protein